MFTCLNAQKYFVTVTLTGKDGETYYVPGLPE
jgi:hypothetical protein